MLSCWTHLSVSVWNSNDTTGSGLPCCKSHHLCHLFKDTGPIPTGVQEENCVSPSNHNMMRERETDRQRGGGGGGEREREREGGGGGLCYPLLYLQCHYSVIMLFPFPAGVVQGTMMGFLTAAGSLARAMGPLLITILYQHKGPAITFPTVVGVIGVSIIVLLLFCRRLVPYRPGSGYRTIN